MGYSPHEKSGYTCLDHTHEVVLAKDINKQELIAHLVLDHGVKAPNDSSNGELGTKHMMMHALMGNPKIAARMGFNFKGSFLTVME